MTTSIKLDQILSVAAEFVVEQKGVWGHDEWECFLGQVAALGVELSDETKRSLGNILEACKHLRALGIATPAVPKKAPAKAKAKPKAK